MYRMHLQGLDEDQILSKLVTEAAEAETRDKRGLSGVTTRLNIRAHAAPRGGSPQRGGGRRGGPPPAMPARRTALRYIYCVHRASCIVHRTHRFSFLFFTLSLRFSLFLPERASLPPPSDICLHVYTHSSMADLQAQMANMAGSRGNTPGLGGGSRPGTRPMSSALQAALGLTDDTEPTATDASGYFTKMESSRKYVYI